jgi:hypothetical protein
VCRSVVVVTLTQFWLKCTFETLEVLFSSNDFSYYRLLLKKHCATILSLGFPNVGGYYKSAKMAEGSSEDGVNSAEQVVVLGVEPVKMMREASSNKGVNALGQVMMDIQLSVPGVELGALSLSLGCRCFSRVLSSSVGRRRGPADICLLYLPVS